MGCSALLFVVMPRALASIVTNQAALMESAVPLLLGAAVFQLSDGIQGVGAGFIPANLHVETLDGTILVTEEDAVAYTQRSAREEGIFIGISSGASLAAVAQKAPEMPDGARVLTFCYDTGERYLSIEGLFPAS